MSLKLALPIALALLVAAPSTFAEDSRPSKPPPLDTEENCNERHLACAEDCGKKHFGEFLNSCLEDCSNTRTYCKNVLTRVSPRDRAPSRKSRDRVRDAG